MKRIIVLGIVVFVVILAWTGAWFYGASFITGYQRQLAEADGVTTPKLTCDSFGVSGWPFAFDVTCSKPSVTYGDLTVTAAALKGSAQVYDPFHVLLIAQAPMNLADAFTGSRSRVDFTSAEASARLTGWRIARISLVADKPVWNDTVLDDRLLARADHLEAHLVDLPDLDDAKAHLAGLGEYVEIDALNAPGFEINAGKATFEGVLDKLPDDVRTYGDADLLKRWQAAGGSFTLKGFNGTDGDTHFSATGQLALDAQGRVNGQVKLSSKGVVERLGPLLPDQYKGLIVGGQAADGSYSQTISIAAGLAFAGLVPVGVIPPVF